MKKLGLSFLFSILLLSMFATATFAVDPANNDFGGDPLQGQNVAIPEVIVGETIENANDTGSGVDTNDGSTSGEVIKAVTGHKTHGEYQSNTNSCASCHQTHTSAGKALLFADTTFQTCASCHDGTLGFYNVFEAGDIATLDGAGTFGGSHANNMSLHQANDSLAIKAAPGGNNNTADADGSGWGASFNCASCHAPHGSYSDRLLHYNPNGMATRADEGGKQLQGLVVATTDPAAKTYGLKQVVSADLLVDESAPANKVYLYNGTVKQTTPMLYGYSGYGQPHFTHLAYTEDVAGVPTAKRIQYGDTDVYFSNEEGYFKALTAKGNDILTNTAPYSGLTGQISLAYVVDMDLQEIQDIDGLKIYKNNQSAYWTEKSLANTIAGSATKDMAGAGVAISTYCSSCHTDYLAKSSSSTGIQSGTFDTAYRHSTTSSSYTCVRCHFAHGTDAEIMMDAQGETVADLVAGTSVDQTYVGNEVAAIDYMLDTNSSSALKKFTNMTVCWACHNSSKATTIKNTNRLADHPVGMPYTSVDFGTIGGIVEIQR